VTVLSFTITTSEPYEAGGFACRSFTIPEAARIPQARLRFTSAGASSRFYLSSSSIQPEGITAVVEYSPGTDTVVLRYGAPDIDAPLIGPAVVKMLVFPWSFEPSLPTFNRATFDGETETLIRGVYDLISASPNGSQRYLSMGGTAIVGADFDLPTLTVDSPSDQQITSVLVERPPGLGRLVQFLGWWPIPNDFTGDTQELTVGVDPGIDWRLEVRFFVNYEALRRVAPLRQGQRDDRYRRGSSKQSSLRQGWKGTYL